MKSIKTLVQVLILSLVFAWPLGVVGSLGSVGAQTADDVCEGVELTGAACENDPVLAAQCQNDPDNAACAGQPEQQVAQVIRRFINIFSSVVGIAGVVMIVFSGFRYITSGGDSNKISSAQQGIIYAIVGLIVAALAQVIIRFVAAFVPP